MSSPGPGVGADRQDPDQVGVDVDPAGALDLDQHRRRSRPTPELGTTSAGDREHHAEHDASDQVARRRVMACSCHPPALARRSRRPASRRCQVQEQPAGDPVGTPDLAARSSTSTTRAVTPGGLARRGEHVDPQPRAWWSPVDPVADRGVAHQPGVALASAAAPGVKPGTRRRSRARVVAARRTPRRTSVDDLRRRCLRSRSRRSRELADDPDRGLGRDAGRACRRLPATPRASSGSASSSRSTRRARPPGPAPPRSPGRHGTARAERCRNIGAGLPSCGSGYSVHESPRSAAHLLARGSSLDVASITRSPTPLIRKRRSKSCRSRQAPAVPPTTPPSDFGANEWLVEEMREQYQADPASVDPDVGRATSATGPATAAAAKASNAPDDRAEAGRAGRAKTEPKAEPRSRAEAASRPAAKTEPKPEAEVRGQARRRRPSRGRSAKAAEPAKGTTNPMPKESRPTAAGRGQRRADLHRAARRAGPHRRRTWTPR